MNDTQLNDLAATTLLSQSMALAYGLVNVVQNARFCAGFAPAEYEDEFVQLAHALEPLMVDAWEVFEQLRATHEPEGGRAEPAPEGGDASR